MDPAGQPLPKLSDITPHKSSATSAPELVESIPIKSQDELKSATNSISSPVDGINVGDKQLGQDLRATSQKIKSRVEPEQNRFTPPLKSKANKVVKKDRRILHFLPVVAAFLVAGILSAAAFYAYDQAGKDQPSLVSQVQKLEATSTDSDDVITPNDLETFSQSVNTDMYGFDDNRDFDQQELSDQALGL